MRVSRTYVIGIVSHGCGWGDVVRKFAVRWGRLDRIANSRLRMDVVVSQNRLVETVQRKIQGFNSPRHPAHVTCQVHGKNSA
jgi:phosphodiesterase/alkaline phosphatase D-like protein